MILVLESPLKGDRDSSVDELAALAMMELWESALEGDRETLEQDSTSLAVTVVQELSLSSDVSKLCLCEEEEEEEEKGEAEPSTPEHPGDPPPALKEAAGCVTAVGSHPVSA